MTTTRTEPSLPVSPGYHPGGTDVRGYLAVRSLPRPERLPEALAALVGKYTTLVKDYQTASRDLQRLEQEIRRAGDVDVDALTEAILAGRDEDPGTPATRAAVQTLHDTRRRRLALERAVIQTWGSIEAEVRRARDELRGDLQRQREPARRRFVKAMDDAAAARGDLQEIENMLAWADGFPATDWRTFGVARVPGIADPHGGLYRWDQLTAALREAAG